MSDQGIVVQKDRAGEFFAYHKRHPFIAVLGSTEQEAYDHCVGMTATLDAAEELRAEGKR